MRTNKLAKNTIASLIFQITTIVCGFILPRLILGQYGSEINGLVNSITQFLHIIAFLELGVGAVVQSSLYKPLADKDNTQISKIVVSAGKFFRRLAQILLAYVVILMLIYPIIAQQNFGHLYTATLILAMSISSFAQYYFGIVNSLLLTADQRGYIQYNAQTITLILNTAVCAVLINAGASIHVVKLMTSLIYLARPVVLYWYVKHNYSIDRKIKYVGEPIKQKWNGVAQHIAAVILDSTATVVLTTFATLEEVSVYSVYHLVVAGVKQLFLSLTNGIQALIGELWAKKEIDELKSFFGWVEWVIHTGTVFIFGCAGTLILPFVQVYTSGIDDVNYLQPAFGTLIVLAHSMHCLRLPYNIMILAGGHYKQTQSNYIIAAILNISISTVGVKLWGLIGVALGTLVALSYQTIWMAVYNSRNLIKWSFKTFVKQMCVNLITVVLASGISSIIEMKNVTYLSWIVMAVQVAVMWAVTIIAVNMLFNRDRMMQLFRKMLRRS